MSAAPPHDPPPDGSPPDGSPPDGSSLPGGGVPSRRRVLTLGAVAAGAVVSIRPALAQTAGSVMTCEIPIPDAGHAGSAIAADGTLVPTGTKGSFPGPGHPFKGEDVKRALAGGQLPGTSWESNRAYVGYVRRLQRGQGGFTCFASLQMPR